jgi:poly(3-hydroxybutyrate) depolymerase
MNRSCLACLSLISAALSVSCSDAKDPNTPLGGAAGLAGSAGAGGMIGGAGTTSSAGTSGASGHGGSVAGGSGGSGTSGGTAGGGAAGASGGSGAGMGGAGGSAAGTGGGGGAGGSGARSKGCDQAPKLTSGSKSIQSGGKNREFMIRVPENYDNAHPYWLIFGFHWLGGTDNDVDSGGTSGYTWSYYGLREQADNSTDFRAIFVAPQGLNNGWGNAGNEDVTLTDDILKQVQEGLCVDTKHIFSVGFSYGGGMTKALGCTRPNVFRGLAVLAGADFLSGGCDGTSTSPVAFFGAHSTTDGTNNYSSGITILNRFVANNGCTAQTPPQPQGNQHVCTKFAGCKEGYPVEWCAFNGGGHTPAPVDGSGNGSGGGDRTWTKTEIWKFFTDLK